MKNRLVLSVIITAGVLVSQALAGTMGSIATPKESTWVGSVSAGPTWARGGETQTFYLDHEIEKTYAARKSIDTFVSGELFIGIQKSLFTQWLGQLGLAVARTGNAHLQGILWDDADPEFDNYSYQYKVGNVRLAAKGKLLLDKGYLLKPWVSASLGFGFNRAHEFTNTPLIPEAIANSNFQNHTKTSFAYTVGAGVQKTLSGHWQIGAGYEFADWGKSELGRSLGQTLNSGLTLAHMYTHGVLFNLTYIA